MSDKEKLVNCGECVHLQGVDREDGRMCLVLGTIGYGENNGNCKWFAPSPLARIAYALERIAEDGVLERDWT